MKGLWTRFCDPAARNARVVQESFAQEGVGNVGRPVHPQPRVRILVVSMHTSIHSEVAGITRHSRTQWFTAYFVLSPAIGLVCHRRLRKLPSANLTPASRRQDHTTSPSALVPFVIGTSSVHRIPSRVRDDREPPLMWDGTAIISEVIWVRPKQQSFCRQDWTGRIELIPRKNFF